MQSGEQEMAKDNKTPDFNYKDKKGDIDLRALMTGVVQKLLGTALDFSRMSGMSDRSFNQLNRSLKDAYYNILDFTLKELEKEGYLKKDSENDQ